MPLPLENLDDRAYADLLDEARTRIPALIPEWTNHNPSDPGITLLELLAWRTEMLVYRTNQVPAEHLRMFLKLLRGPDETTPEGDAAVRPALDHAVAELRRRFRAVTAEDFEALSTGEFNDWLSKQHRAEVKDGVAGLTEWAEVTGLDPADPGGCPSSVWPIARARCVPDRDFGALRLERRNREAPGHVSVVIVPTRDGTPAPETFEGEKAPMALMRAAPPPRSASAEVKAVWGFLDERRTLTTQHHVVEPRYVPVRARMLVVLRPDVPGRGANAPAALHAPHDAGSLDEGYWRHVQDIDARRALVRVLEGFFDPVSGGRDGSGWPFGRGVYLSELYKLLEDQEMVDYVSTLQVCSSDDRARLLWNDQDQAFGLVLGLETGAAALQLLPRLQIGVEDVLVCSATVPVEVTVTLPPVPDDVTPQVLNEVHGAIHMALHGAFPPFGASPVPAEGDGTWAVPRAVADDARATLQRALGEIFAGRPEVVPGRGGWQSVTVVGLLDVLAGLPAKYGTPVITLGAEEPRLEKDRAGNRVAVKFVAGEAAEVHVSIVHTTAPAGGADA